MTDRAFQRLWAGSTATSVATAMLPVLLAIAVLDATGSATLLGLAVAARTVGFVVITPAAGVLADRASRRLVMCVAAVVAATGTVLLALLLTASTLVVLVVAFLVGAGQGGYRPAFQAGLADVVPALQLQQANALSSVGARVAVVISPGAAAGLAIWAGARPTLAATGLLWLVVLATPRMRAPRPAAPRAQTSLVAGLAGDFTAGLHEARRHRWFFAALLALAAQLATGYAATQVLLPVVSRENFGGDALLAAALTALTLGALLGALVLTRWHPAPVGHVALAGMALYAAAPLSLAWPAPAPVVLGAHLLAGVGVSLFNVPWFTAVAREVPAHLRARVSSLDFLVSYGLAPIGIVLIAPAAAATSTTATLLACAAICLIAPLLAALIPTTRAFRTEPTR